MNSRPIRPSSGGSAISLAADACGSVMGTNLPDAGSVAASRNRVVAGRPGAGLADTRRCRAGFSITQIKASHSGQR
jgi:hypothetical protein